MTISDICSSAAEDKGNQTSFFRAPANQCSCEKDSPPPALCAQDCTLDDKCSLKYLPLKARYLAQLSPSSFPMSASPA